ncbi:hypothetical protein MCAMS1_01402 [biofilm metagenome]
MNKPQQIQVGLISGVFGIKGWLKIASYTAPKDNILNYKPWLLKKGNEEKTVKVIAGKLQGKGLIAQIDGINDRDQAQLLIGWAVYINHAQLPALKKGEYYWADLVGLEVENTDGIHFGKVESLIETGSNDILLVNGDKERAIPFLQGQTIQSIDLVAGKMIVDWDADF